MIYSCMELSRLVAATGTFALMHVPPPEVLGRHRQALLIAIGPKLSEIAQVSILTIFCIAYVSGTLHLPGKAIINGVLPAGAAVADTGQRPDGGNA